MKPMYNWQKLQFLQVPLEADSKWLYASCYMSVSYAFIF